MTDCIDKKKIKKKHAVLIKDALCNTCKYVNMSCGLYLSKRERERDTTICVDGYVFFHGQSSHV